MTGLIKDTADYWKSRGVEIRQWLDDGGGKYAFHIRVKFSPTGATHDYYVSARQTRRDPLGVMKKLVAQAHNADALLLLRVGDDQHGPRHYVFDPLTILRNGTDHTAADNRADRGERWIDFRLGWGVRLCDFIEDGERPPDPVKFRHLDLDPLPDQPDYDPDAVGDRHG